MWMWICILILFLIVIGAVVINLKYPKLYKKMDNSLMVALVAAMLTLVFTPYINKEFEKQSIHSKYILDNLKNLKLDTLAIYNEIREISRGKKDLDKFSVLKLNIEYRVIEIDLLLGKTDESKILLDTLNTLSSHIKKDDEYRIFLLKNFVNASRNMTLYLATQSKVFDQNIDPLKIYSKDEIEMALKEVETFKESKK